MGLVELTGENSNHVQSAFATAAADTTFAQVTASDGLPTGTRRAKDGGRGWVRTSDPRRVKTVLSH